jgi:hypothetical protein
MRLSITLLASAPLLFAAFAACSSSTDTGTPPPSTTQDAATPSPQPSTQPTPFQPIPLTIVGSGRVVTKDSSLDCTSDGTTQSGKCSVMYPGDTLYAQHGYNWSFDHWEPSMGEDSTLYIPLRDGPTALTAVFRNLAVSGSSSGGAPSDSGAD